ncbi:MAG: M14 family zinc carboxypeptidase, partial [Fibrobacteria bacterium]
DTDPGKITFGNLTTDMADLRKRGDALKIVDAAVEDIGTSSGGRKLLALRLGRNPACKVLLVGCHHSREWISVEVPFLVGKYLIDNYKEASAAKTAKEKIINHLVDNAEIWIVPMLNPDGHNQTTTLSLGMWRANTRNVKYPADVDILREVEIAPYHTGVISDASGSYDFKCYKLAPKAIPGKTRTVTETISAGTYTGVDLNRNYPVPAGPMGSAAPPWGTETFNPTVTPNKIAGGYYELYGKTGAVKGIIVEEGFNLATSRSPNPPDTFCGPSGGSEPEVKALTKLMGLGGFKSAISYHNYSQLLLYPDDAALHAQTQFLGKGMRDLFKDQKTKYAYESGSGLYPTSGDSMEWAWRVESVVNYTIELPPTESDAKAKKWGFNRYPESKIDEVFKHNLPVALCNINCAIAGMTPPAPVLGKSGKVMKAGPNCWEVFKGWVP